MVKKRLIPKLLLKRRRLGTVERMVLVTTRGYEQVIEVTTDEAPMPAPEAPPAS